MNRRSYAITLMAFASLLVAGVIAAGAATGIQGFVKTQPSPDGVAVVNGWVEIYDSNGDFFDLGFLDSEGHYVVVTPVGNYFALTVTDHFDELWFGIDCPTYQCDVTTGNVIVVLNTQLAPANHYLEKIFLDGFESGNFEAWSSVVGNE